MATIVPAQQTAIANLYTALFNRAPDATGFGFWVQALSNGASLSTITQGFLSSPESKAIYPASQTSEQFITTFYTTVFGRAPDAAGLAFWAGVVNANGGSSSDAAKSVAVSQIINVVSTQLTTKPADITDAQFAQTVADRGTFINKGVVGVYFAVEAKGTSTDAAKQVLVGVDATAASVTAAKLVADSAAGGGGNTSLTIGVDNVVGTAGNDTFNAYIGATAGTSTLTGADVINGGSGIDTLNLIAEGTSGLTGQITNVEIFNIRQTGGAGTYSFADVQGETQVWNNVSASNVTFNNLGTGTTIGVRGNGVSTVSNTAATYATATDAVTLAVAGGIKNAGAAPTVAVTGTAIAATINSTGGANVLGAVQLSSAEAIKTIAINATTDLTAELTATDFAADSVLTITGAGKVTLNAGFDGATINAAANTGGVVLSTVTGATKTVTGSSAADVITLVGSLATGGAINLGAGNDKLLAGAAATIGTGLTIDGGEGFDTIAASLINAANASSIKNFEGLDLSTAGASPLDVALVTGSTVQKLFLSGGTGGFTINNVAAAIGLDVSGSNAGVTTVNLKDALTTTTDTFTTTFAGLAASTATAAAPTVIAAGTIVTNEVETLNVASSGTGFVSNTIVITDNKLATLNITGDKALSLTFAGTNGTTGGAGTTGGVTVINGSAATGALTINTTGVTVGTTATLTVTGGSGNDIVTLAQKATVVLGAGNDTVTTSLAGGTLTGGAGNDKFEVAASLVTAGALTEGTGVIKNIITDFQAGDSMKLLPAAASFTAAKITLDGTVTNLDQALTQAAVGTNAVTWFQYGADTFVVSNEGTAGIGAGDLVVKLTGLVDLTNAKLDTATDFLTL